MRFPYFALITVLIAACAHTGPEPYSMPAGSTIVVNENITIPGSSASVVMQDGKTTPYLTANRYAPHCILELQQRKEAPQVVKPGRFTVTKNVQNVGSGSTLMPVAFLNEMYLASPDQPDVFRLTCRQYNMIRELISVEDGYTTVAQMRIALGHLISLNPLLPKSEAAKK